MKKLLLLVALCGCWTDAKLLGWNSAIQVVLSEDIARMAKTVADIAEEEQPQDAEKPTSMDAIIGLAAEIQKDAKENKDRAVLAGLYHNHLPDELPAVGTDEDNLNKTALAHVGMARDNWRRWAIDLPKNLGRALGQFGGGVVRAIIPGWVITLAWSLVAALMVSAALLVFLWVRGRMFKRAAIQGVCLAEKHLELDVLDKTRGTPLQKVYRMARDKGLLPK